MIHVYTTSRYKVQKKELEKAAQNFLEKAGAGGFHVNLIFIGKRKMKSIANEYGHGDVAKPVLAFPLKDVTSEESGAPMLGEVYVCYPQAVLLAAERDKTVDAMLQWLVEHGITNLLKE